VAIVAHAPPFVIGVDTHARSHAVAVLDTSTGARIDAAQFPSSKAGFTRAPRQPQQSRSGSVEGQVQVRRHGHPPLGFGQAGARSEPV